jgi:plastocyanin
MRVPVMIGAVFALAVFGGCSGGGGGATPTPVAATATPVAATVTPVAATPTPATQAITCNATGTGTPVAIADFTYNPASATVAVNGLVTWTNSDGARHTVTFDSGPNCGNLESGAIVTAQFTAAGTYPYHCAIHSSMRGTVVVQ